jgi:hypothetical protein
MALLSEGQFGMFFGPTKGVTKLLARSLAGCRWEASASPSFRDTPIVAWHEVPGKASSKEPSRRSSCEIQRWRWSETLPRHLGIVPFCLAMPPHVRAKTFSIDSCVHLQESYRTLRDGSFGVALSQALRATLRSHRPSGTLQTSFS